MKELRVLVLDTLLQQADKSNRRLPADVLPRLYKEYRTLAKLEKEGYNALYAYLTQNNNGKQMQGVNGITIFKYDLTKGDRILYAYGKDLPFYKKKRIHWCYWDILTTTTKGRWQSEPILKSHTILPIYQMWLRILIA